jgi:hypothetical protein
MKKTYKGLVIAVIFLFIGVALVPSINFTVVKASDDNDLVEVTTEACGIKGYRGTTMKMTRQQYNNLEQLLGDFRARLNKTTDSEKISLLFKEVIIELNRCGLLPKRMSVEQVQTLIMGKNLNPRYSSLLDRIQESYRKNAGAYENSFCLMAGKTTTTVSRGLIMSFASFLTLYLLILHTLPLPVFDLITCLMLYFLGAGVFFSDLSPLMFKSTVGIGCFSPMGPGGVAMPFWYPAEGWLYTNGLNGMKNWSGRMWGNISLYRMNYGMFEFYPGALGFSGIKIGLPSSNSFYLGHAITVKVTKNI